MCKILVVEDEPHYKPLYERLLVDEAKKWNLTLDLSFVESVGEAMEFADKHNVVLLDLGLRESAPNVTAMCIRELSEKAAVVVATAYADFSGMRKLCISQGADDFFDKGILVRDTFQAIDRIINARLRYEARNS